MNTNQRRIKKKIEWNKECRKGYTKRYILEPLQFLEYSMEHVKLIDKDAFKSIATYQLQRKLEYFSFQHLNELKHHLHHKKTKKVISNSTIASSAIKILKKRLPRHQWYKMPRYKETNGTVEETLSQCCRILNEAIRAAMFYYHYIYPDAKQIPLITEEKVGTKEMKFNDKFPAVQSMKIIIGKIHPISNRMKIKKKRNINDE